MSYKISGQITLDDLFASYSDGDQIGWEREFRWLRNHDWPAVEKLCADIHENGIKVPILLGSDGRVWDGHHRIFAAKILGLDSLPMKEVIE